MRLFGSKPETPRRPAQQPGRNQAMYSYYASRTRAETPLGREPLPPAVAARQWRTHWLRNLPAIAAIAVIGVSVLYCLSLQTTPKIIQIKSEGSGGLVRDSAIYQEAAQRVLRRSFMNRSKLSVDTAGLSQALKTEFPELSDVNVTIPLISRRPLISLSLAEPALVISGQSGGAYVLDENGKVILPVSEIEHFGSLDIPVVSDLSGLKIELGKNVLTRSDVAFIREVYGQLRVKGLNIEVLSLPAVASELHVRLSGAGYFVKFNLAEEAREQAGTFIAVKERLDAEEKVPAEYVDVRVDEKAYYR